MIVPTGTLMTTSSPFAPVLLRPDPFRPSAALYSLREMRSSSVPRFSSASMITLPP